jgi:predicted TPR repeat methyltransferase
MSTVSADASTRELTVDEAVAIAIQLQRQDQLREAHELFHRVLEMAPDHPDALHYSGVLAHQQGRNTEAITLIERSLTLVPDRADWHSNLGIVFRSEGRFEDAIARYRRAIELDPDHANAFNNLGVLLRATGRPVEAEAAYRSAIERNPSHADAYTNLGILLNSLKRLEEASACFCKAITFQPKHRDARRLLALAHCALGEIGEAVKIFAAWHAEEPDDPIAEHMLAACTGGAVPARASNAFVATTFDHFAASFESKLQRLYYRAPALVLAAVEEAGVTASKSLDVLDAGCGTGLCGPLLAPYARRMTGVDLSEGMLARAREKNVYDLLVRAELTDFLRSHHDAFDLIVSADTLVYFGDLKPAVSAIAVALRPGGFATFTLEHAVGAPSRVDYRLEYHGRYSHTQPYVEALLAAAGLATHVHRGDLRLEGGIPVAGLIIRAAKPSSPFRTARPPAE